MVETTIWGNAMLRLVFAALLLLSAPAHGANIVAVDCGVGPAATRQIFDGDRHKRQVLVLEPAKALESPLHGRILQGDVTDTELVVHAENLAGKPLFKYSISRVTGTADFTPPNGKPIHYECKAAPDVKQFVAPIITPDAQGFVSVECAEQQTASLTIVFDPKSMNMMIGNPAAPELGVKPAGAMFKADPDAISFCLVGQQSTCAEPQMLLNTITGKLSVIDKSPEGNLIFLSGQPATICKSISKPAAVQNKF
jgi:hypothetical protein